MITNFEKFREFTDKIKQDYISKPEINIFVSLGTCGIAAGAALVYIEFVNEIKKRSISGRIDVTETGCMGLCYCEPSVEVIDKVVGKSVIYGNVKKEDIPKIIDSILDNAVEGVDIIKYPWYYPEIEENKGNCYQAKIVLRDTGRMD